MGLPETPSTLPADTPETPRDDNAVDPNLIAQNRVRRRNEREAAEERERSGNSAEAALAQTPAELSRTTREMFARFPDLKRVIEDKDIRSQLLAEIRGDTADAEGDAEAYAELKVRKKIYVLRQNETAETFFADTTANKRFSAIMEAANAKNIDDAITFFKNLELFYRSAASRAEVSQGKDKVFQAVCLRLAERSNIAAQYAEWLRETRADWGETLLPEFLGNTLDAYRKKHPFEPRSSAAATPSSTERSAGAAEADDPHFMRRLWNADADALTKALSGQ